MAKNPIHKGLILLVVALAQFMVVLDISIVNIAIPDIASDLHFKPADLQWVITIYTLCFGGFLLLGGRAADLFGRRRVFMYGVLAFTTASLLVGLSQNSSMIVALRALQGLSAAFMSPAALSIIITTFKEGAERNKALGVWGGVAAAGAAAGVLLGGVLTEYLGWRWCFFVNVPMGMFILFMTLRVIPESKMKLKYNHLDIPGAALVTSGLMLLVFSLVKAPTYGWTSHTIVLMMLASAVLLASFVVNELRSKQPLIPLDIFKNRNLSASNAVQMSITAGMFAMFFFLSVYIQTVLHFSPVKAGLAFLPVTVVIGIASAIVSNLVTKIGYKIPMVIAPLFLCAGMVIFSQMPVGGSYLTDVLPGLAVMSLGLGFSFVTITIAATSGVPHDRSGLASGILNTSQQIGGALGLAVLSGVYASTFADSLKTGSNQAAAQVAGFHNSFLVGAGFAFTASVLALVFIKHRRGEVPTSEAVHVG